MQLRPRESQGCYQHPGRERQMELSRTEYPIRPTLPATPEILRPKRGEEFEGVWQVKDWIFWGIRRTVQ